MVNAFALTTADTGAFCFGGCLVQEAYNARKGKNRFVVYDRNYVTIGWFATMKAAEKAAEKAMGAAR